MVVACVLIELVLRFYNPFAAPLRGEEITPIAHSKKVYSNDRNPKLRSNIEVSTNSLGFRGPEPSESTELSVVMVGGSTTFCPMNSDQDHWPALVGKQLTQDFQNLWWNNAGMNGHSTRGHLQLMERFIVPLKPDIVVFLVGINDTPVQRTTNDRRNEKQSKGLKSVLRNLLYKSEIVNTISNLSRSRQAVNDGLIRSLNFDFKRRNLKEMSQEEREAFLTSREEIARGFLERMESLIDICKKNSIEPVLITQPTVLGPSIDPSTGIDLGKLEYAGINGELLWDYLNGLINQKTRDLAEKYDVPLIDLAESMEKDSQYYWDFHHYSVEGNKRVASLIYPELQKEVERISAHKSQSRQLSGTKKP